MAPSPSPKKRGGGGGEEGDGEGLGGKRGREWEAGKEGEREDRLRAEDLKVVKSHVHHGAKSRNPVSQPQCGAATSNASNRNHSRLVLENQRRAFLVPVCAEIVAL